jgi:hypothetical protein
MASVCVPLVHILCVAPVGSVAYRDQDFTPVRADDVSNIGLLKVRACADFGWGAPTSVALFLVPDEARARVIQFDPSSAKDILLGDSLFATDAVVAGSWILARVQPPHATAAGGRAIPVPVGNAVLDFEALARSGGVGDFLASVAVRAKTRFAQRVSNALTEQLPADAARVYWDTEQLPSTTTVHTFELDGFHMNGPLYEGSELTVCYRGTRAYVIKGIHATDALRLTALRDSLAQVVAAGLSAPQHIAPFELRTSPAGRTYVVMPRYMDTLERMPPLNDAVGIATLWEHMSAALTDLHELGFAHGDVKPANVCVDGNGDFFLIDLDSAARFGSTTQTTTEYLPIDERGVRVIASARADWWALAMTFAEKACGAASLPLGHGSRVWMASEVRVHLEAHLPASVWMALAGHII